MISDLVSQCLLYQIFYNEKEKNHLINSNTQLQEDLVKLIEASKREKELIEGDLKAKIQNLEESNFRYVEVHSLYHIWKFYRFFLLR